MHHAELSNRLRTIEAYRAQWSLGGWELAFDRGWRGQWAALHYLALLGADVLGAIAAKPAEIDFVESFAPRREELVLAYEAHKNALDFSKSHES